MEGEQILTPEICFRYVKSLFSTKKIATSLKTDSPGHIGLEVEGFPYHRHGSGVSFSGKKKPTIQEIFKQPLFSHWEPNQELSTDLIHKITINQEDYITFEPGSQIEISLRPLRSLDLAMKSLTQIQSELTQTLVRKSAVLAYTGMNPSFNEDEIGLQIQKPRYLAMDHYFSYFGHHGRKMMRQSSGFQVNLDLGDSANIIAKRFILANLLAPYATAVFANSSVIAGELKTLKSSRAFSWQRLDPSRTGILLPADWRKDCCSLQCCIEAYHQFVMRASVLFIGDNILTPGWSFAHWLDTPYRGMRPTFENFKTHLSLLFPEVRVRGFFEFRSVDTLPPVWQSVPAAFYSGLLYDEHSLLESLALLTMQNSDPYQMFKQAVFGLEDEKLFIIAQKIALLAYEGFCRLPESFTGLETRKNFSKFLEHFTLQRRTPADDQRNFFRYEEKSSKKNLGFLSALDNHWQRVAL